MIPQAGRQYKTAELKNEALEQLTELEREVNEAATIARERLTRKRNAARPKVDSATAARYARQIERMADAGIGLDEIIREYEGNATALRVLQDEIRPLTRSLRPQDPNAADGYEAALFEATLDAYGESYRKAHDEVQAIERAAYMANVAVDQATAGVKDPNDTPAIPNSEGTGLVYGAA